jgi:hypothetical protein
MKRNIILFCFFLSIAYLCAAADKTAQTTDSDHEKIVIIICEKIEKIYPDKKIAVKVVKGLTKNLASGKYKNILSSASFASSITNDMEELSNDKHLDLLYDPPRVEAMKKNLDEGSDAAYLASSIEQERMNNFGFKELKILEGNIGYLDLRVFFAAKYAGDTAVAAMNFFSYCDAIIIDLRKNGGGWDSMVTLLLSFFIDPEEEIVLKVTRSTIDDTYYPSMTAPYVPGKKHDTLPLYILTSGSTASAAEAFVFRMKQLNPQAVIVGARTAGAENPISFQILDDNFILKIPSYKVVYAKGNGGWEGKGIQPDIETNEEDALQAAYLKALMKLKSSTAEKIKMEKYQWAIDGIKTTLKPHKIDANILPAYVGKYGNYRITLAEGSLYYRFKNRKKRKLIAIKDDYFLIEGIDYYRLRFLKEDNEVTSLRVEFNDGYVITSQKEDLLVLFNVSKI